jgi:Ca2+-transporting ATPase
MELCDRILVNDRASRIGTEDKRKIEDQNEKMACQGMRVLGIACGSFIREDEGMNGAGLVWLGLVGIVDPVREGVADVIRTFHGAGIRTVMITGDQSMTAAAIGKKLKLNPDSEGEPLEVLEAQQLSGMDTETLRGLADRLHIFARVSPAHKLRIVKSIQSAGEVVAMTGDGINDGPALKAADVGVAMGGQGTDVAREVADVILEDDNLASMAEAVASGRTIYTNIRKSLHFLLSTNSSEVLMMLGALTLGLGQPLNPLQLLWINLISDIFPGLALAMEPPEPGVMKRPPRDPAEPILTRDSILRIGRESLVLTTGGMVAYGWGIYRYGIGQGPSPLLLWPPVS